MKTEQTTQRQRVGEKGEKKGEEPVWKYRVCSTNE